MPAHLFSLSSIWNFAHPRQKVWDVMADPTMSWPLWWPGCSLAAPLEHHSDVHSSADEQILTTTAALKFRASYGYTLMVLYHPTRVNSPREVTFDARGDLVGQGRAVLSSIDEQCTRVEIEWNVRPTSRWMQLLSPLAAPAFKHAHAVLMAKGETGLRNYLGR
ncbi:hypothetical protein ACQR35_13035 [Pseudarthrobacter sp. J1738]|uniref:hypothetical protein n=1 Tax=Pseudarthrobacter sp. J1738 TaxID=3420446 RepID=UPI003D2D3A3F